MEGTNWNECLSKENIIYMRKPSIGLTIIPKTIKKKNPLFWCLSIWKFICTNQVSTFYKYNNFNTQLHIYHTKSRSAIGHNVLFLSMKFSFFFFFTFLIKNKIAIYFVFLSLSNDLLLSYDSGFWYFVCLLFYHGIKYDVSIACCWTVFN